MGCDQKDVQGGATLPLSYQLKLPKLNSFVTLNIFIPE